MSAAQRGRLGDLSPHADHHHMTSVPRTARRDAPVEPLSPISMYAISKPRATRLRHRQRSTPDDLLKPTRLETGPTEALPDRGSTRLKA